MTTVIYDYHLFRRIFSNIGLIQVTSIIYIYTYMHIEKYTLLFLTASLNIKILMTVTDKKNKNNGHTIIKVYICQVFS